MREPLVEVENLKKYFPIVKGVFSKTVGYVKAVDDVSFTIRKGETLGLVGESGCGKSTLGRTILRLLDKTAGKVFFQGQDLYSYKKEQLRKLRPKLQIIFQDPYSSLNPRMTVENIIGEALLDHGLVPKNEVRDKVLEAIQACGLASYHSKRYPHEFSGGQRQRIGIARALILNPEFIVADEPVSALDVSIQSQIINMLGDLQQQHGFSYLFISHDLSVVKHISHRVGVMYVGSLVEMATKEELYSHPAHPYTKALLSAVPIPDPAVKRQRILLHGDTPNPSNPPPGCKFHTRCAYVTPRCKEEVPAYREIAKDHFVACHVI
ncbi:Oligopeptide transport ATP-binding protein OppF [Sporomusa rhizae]|uniref:ABC transporter ATP-binding protein n=1 Tax=Sporomusa rhizae TaxID=357999 RepID=UPI003A6DC96C